MRVVIAPQAFKSTLSADAVAEAMATGVSRALPDAEVFLAPVADGGEGTLTTLMSSTDGVVRESRVSDPRGDLTWARWGILGLNGAAVIETAEAIGIEKFPPGRSGLCELSSLGVGQLIGDALDLGIRDFLIGVGGTATNDAGVGMLRALGYKFLDSNGDEIEGAPCSLINLENVDTAGIDARLKDCRFEVMCDGSIPLTGPRGASLSRSQQKGAKGDEPELLEAALLRFANITAKCTGVEIESAPMTGCGGGIAGACMAFLNASLTLGIDRVIAIAGLEKLVAKADLVITGEGQVDRQTIEDKAPIGVAELAKRYQVPVLLVAALVGPDHQGVFDRGVTQVVALLNSNKQEGARVATEQMISDAVEAVLIERVSRPW
jgi:glycerate 2-kinase